MGRDYNDARLSVMTTIVVRHEVMLMEVEEDIKRFGFDLQEGTGYIGGLREEDKPRKARAMEEFSRDSGLHIDVHDGSRAFSRLGTYSYHMGYNGSLDKLRRKS